MSVVVYVSDASVVAEYVVAGADDLAFDSVGYYLVELCVCSCSDAGGAALVS